MSILQASEVGFIEDVDELGLEGEVRVLDLTEDVKLFLVLAIFSPITTAVPLTFWGGAPGLVGLRK